MTDIRINAIDTVLRTIKPALMPMFVAKWSQHKHTVSNSKKTITIDGCWKLFRSKCAQDIDDILTPEFGSVVTGCVESPQPKSYFCKEHENYGIQVQVDNDTVIIKPSDIKITKLGFVH